MIYPEGSFLWSMFGTDDFKGVEQVVLERDRILVKLFERDELVSFDDLERLDLTYMLYWLESVPDLM